MKRLVFKLTFRPLTRFIQDFWDHMILQPNLRYGKKNTRFAESDSGLNSTMQDIEIRIRIRVQKILNVRFGFEFEMALRFGVRFGSNLLDIES